ncbi:MAG: helix-turn-helix transcriptional regulator [Clostridia bacterium]|nr:helix-turn-helix transcriptional regulator [Clostridia bacterium]
MKLDLGYHIKNNRRIMELTQEELAAELGVSPQAISRWENGTTYPDLELLPTIAAFFGVSVDSMLSCSSEAKEKVCTERSERFVKAANESDITALISVIREIRRDMRECHEYNFFEMYNSIWNNKLYENKDVMAEIRLLTDAALTHCSRYEQYNIIHHMAELEDDEHIDGFIRENAVREDLTEAKLRLYRYRRRGDWEKHEPIRKFHLWYTIDNLTSARANWTRLGKFEPEYTKWHCKLNLDYINAVCDLSPSYENIVSGFGGVDLFCECRVTIGMQYAEALAKLGEYENALTVLEDIASLVERIMAIDNKEEFLIGTTSPALEGFTAKARFYCLEQNDGFKHRELCLNFEYDWNTWILPRWYIEDLDGKWFHSIRDDERFVKISKRLEACDLKQPACCE